MFGFFALLNVCFLENVVLLYCFLGNPVTSYMYHEVTNLIIAITYHFH